MLVASGGFVSLWRDQRISAGKTDIVAQSVVRIPNPGLLSKVRLRFLLGRRLRPGDIVRVKSLAEIQATLAADRTLDGLPFMPEMEVYRDQTFLVHRRVDKINDMRHFQRILAAIYRLRESLVPNKFPN
jgi:hypothetical protein